MKHIIKFSSAVLSQKEDIEKVVAIIKKYQGSTTFVVCSNAQKDAAIQKAGRLAAKKDESYKKIYQEIELGYFGLIRELIPIQRQAQVLAQTKKQTNQIEAILEGICVLGECTAKVKAALSKISYQIISKIIYWLLEPQIEKISYVAATAMFITDNDFSKAEIAIEKTRENIQHMAAAHKNKIIIIAGNTGKSPCGAFTSFGRAGSDATAAVIAHSIGAAQLELYNKQGGFFMVNHRSFRKNCIKRLSYREAFELSHFGNETIYPPTLHNIAEKKIPVVIQSILEENKTLINDTAENDEPIVKGMSHIKDMNLVAIQGGGMVGVPGFARRVFESLAHKNINVVFISQAASEQSICVGVSEQQVEKAQKQLQKTFAREIVQKKIEPIQVVSELTIIALVGDKMKNYSGISGKLFKNLGENHINIRAIAQGVSEKNISVVIDSAATEQALQGLYEAFFKPQNHAGY